ncbi:MAG: MFS transporter [Thermoleophilia bacterium]
MTESRRRTLVLVAMSAAVSLVLFDQTVVATALPAIGTATGFSPSTVHWIVDSYLVALAAFVIVGGRLGDRFGRRRMFLVGAVMLSVGSLMSGAATSPLPMLAGRVLQGIGAGLLQPNGLAIVSDVYGGADRGKALGNVIGISSVFLMAGPVVGGPLVDGPGRRTIFLIIPVVAMAAAGLTLWVVRPTTRTARIGIDVVGSLLLGGSLTSILVAMTEGPGTGWASPSTLAYFIVGVVLALIFIWHEHRAADPLLDLALIRTRAMASPLLAGWVCQFIAVAMTVYAAIYFQRGLGETAFIAGLMFLPAVVPVLLAPATGRLSDRRGARLPMAIGSGLLAMGSLVVAIGGFAASYLWIAIGLGIVGIGRPFVLTPMTTACISAAPDADSAVAAGTASASRFLGGSVGVAVCGAAFAGILSRATLPTSLSGVPGAGTAFTAGLDQSPDALALVAALPPSDAATLTQALADFMSQGFGTAMAVCAGVGVLGLLAALWMPRATRDHGARKVDDALSTPSIHPTHL